MTSRSSSSSNAKTLLLWLGGAVVVIGLVAVVVGGNSSSAGADHPDLQGAPVVTGESLPPFQSSENDPAVGSLVPEVVGADFDGTPVSIENNGKAKMIVFLAHWCQFCQAEVPELTDWLENNELPDNVELIAVATSIDRLAVNFPPSEWLEREGFPAPVILDSAAAEAYLAYGAGGFPFWAMVGPDGTLLARATGAGQVNLTDWTTILSVL
ncbi:MAG: TlpA family protein disulfide reductase [Acidimicrobiia bacterium]|nr:TlpA family protein disulfide reductase [Acidimicrobiia bacterium]NNF88833.1 TlpA family protein disulfide reductase [Acidimicrobiia bacterium]